MDPPSTHAHIKHPCYPFACVSSTHKLRHPYSPLNALLPSLADGDCYHLKSKILFLHVEIASKSLPSTLSLGCCWSVGQRNPLADAVVVVC